MGLFLSALGVIGASSSEVQGAMKDFRLTWPGMDLDPLGPGRFQLLSGGTTNDRGVGMITTDGPNTSVLFPAHCAETEEEELAKTVSERLGKPTFWFHIYDGDLWMYRLFNNGQEIDSFNPLPDYWQEASDEEKAKWRGNASAVAGQIPGLSPDAISRYLVAWSEDDADMGKAYPDDEFEIGDVWQMTDFMKRVGLQYPMDKGVSALPYGIRGEYKEATNSARTTPPQRTPSTGQQKKPWWKFW